MGQNIAARKLFKNIDRSLVLRFLSFHKKNPGIYRLFCDYSFRMKNLGRTRYSAWIVINRVRWEFDLGGNGETFKINNDFIALYARLMISDFPQFEDFFSLRLMKSSGRKISLEDASR